MERVFHELRVRRGSGYLCPKLASAGKELWVQYDPDPIRVRALSPSDASIVTARARFAELASKVQEHRLRLPRLEPNDTSVTISVEFARSAELLFGADLEDRNVEGVGWKAVLSDWHPALGKHTVFKIAHHGSPNGHVKEVWEHMLDLEPYAVTTPFCQGLVRLPGPSDCERIASLTPNGYLTATPEAKEILGSQPRSRSNG